MKIFEIPLHVLGTIDRSVNIVTRSPIFLVNLRAIRKYPLSRCCYSEPPGKKKKIIRLTNSSNTCRLPVSLTSRLDSGFLLSCVDFPGRSTIFSRCPWKETWDLLLCSSLFLSNHSKDSVAEYCKYSAPFGINKLLLFCR